MIEISRFRLRDGVDAATFRDADYRLQADFAYQQPGLVRRTTARSAEGEWIVIDLWQSAEAADGCAERWETDPVVAEWKQFIEVGSLRSYRYQEID